MRYRFILLPDGQLGDEIISIVTIERGRHFHYPASIEIGNALHGERWRSRRHTEQLGLLVFEQNGGNALIGADGTPGSG